MGIIKKNLDMGQHFLIDKKVLSKEIEFSKISKEDKIIEIGAGEGILTRELAKHSKKVLAFEIDEQYKNKLGTLMERFPNLEIVYSDATEYSWEGFDKIISNIPYHLGEKVIIKAIIHNIPFIVLIVGENFKEILENNTTKSGILANLFYEVQFIKKIEKESFLPPPRVNSWLIKLTSKDAEKKSNFLRYILKREGKIKNGIVYGLVNEGFTKNEAKTLLKEFKIDNRVLESSTKRISGKMILKILNYMNDYLKN